MRSLSIRHCCEESLASVFSTFGSLTPPADNPEPRFETEARLRRVIFALRTGDLADARAKLDEYAADCVPDEGEIYPSRAEVSSFATPDDQIGNPTLVVAARTPGDVFLTLSVYRSEVESDPGEAEFVTYCRLDLDFGRDSRQQSVRVLAALVAEAYCGKVEVDGVEQSVYAALAGAAVANLDRSLDYQRRDYGVGQVAAGPSAT